MPTETYSKLTLEEGLEQAKESGKYYITITEKRGDKLNHTNFLGDFPRSEIMPTLEKLAELLKPLVDK